MLLWMVISLLTLLAIGFRRYIHCTCCMCLYCFVIHLSANIPSGWLWPLYHVDLKTQLQHRVFFALKRNLGFYKSSHRRYPINIAVLKNFTKFTGKVCRPQACNFINKETLTQLFSCELWKTFENTFFVEHLWAKL